MRGCCDTGICATHLAEGKADFSTLWDGTVSMKVPNFDEQKVVIAFAKAVLDKHYEGRTTDDW